MEGISAYKISTITATGSVNTPVNLDVLFENLTIEEVSSDAEGILYAEYGTRRRGRPKKANVANKILIDGHKRFDNQLTLEYRMALPSKMTVMNCKIFRNGNVQMTGVKYIEQGVQFVDRIIETIKRCSSRGVDGICKLECLQNTNYLVRMINCDYKIGFSIKRDALFRLMINEYENIASFEPCIYPGVKIQYMWNKHNSSKDGLCQCEESCIQGKGDGMSLGKCKKITVAVFQSGCVIITGAQSI